MKTSVIEVRDMLSVLSVLRVEERIGKVPGVESVTVNYAAGSATVRYDETRLEIADIKSAVRQSGYESAAPAAASAGGGHEGHTAPGAPPAIPAPAAPKTAPVAPATAGAASAGTTQQEKAAPDAAPSTTPHLSPAAQAAAPAPTPAAPKPAAEAAATPAAPAGGKQLDKGAPAKS
jgi:P-type Cu2+ transporter